MTFDEFESRALETATYPGKKELIGILYCGLGAAGEAGEVANKLKKVLRDNNCEFDLLMRVKIAKEMGGVLWYLAALAVELGFSLEQIAALNLEELRGRRERGTIHGDGDDR